MRAVQLLLALWLLWGCDSATPGPQDESERDEPACYAVQELLSCQPMAPADLTTVPPQVVADAAKLAAVLSVRRIQSFVDSGKRPPGRQNTEIPPELSTTIFNALIHLWSADLAERDTVLEVLAVPIMYRPRVDGFSFQVPDSLVRLQTHLARGLETDIPVLDSVLSAFQFFRESEETYEARIFDYRTVEWRNYRPLVRELELVPAVNYPWQGGQTRCFWGPCMDVEAAFFEWGIELSYTRLWGDCPAGCTGRRTWVFDVLPDGRVFLESARD